MKKTYFILLSLFSFGITRAQITLQSSTAAPVAGDVYNYEGIDTSASIGSSGANVTWDFSALSISATDTFSESFVSATGTPFASTYPAATIALQSGATYDYYSLSSSLYAFVGEGSTSSAVGLMYSKPVQQFSFPFTYGSAFNTPFAGHTSGSPFQDSIIGTNAGIGDAYGTLKLPGVTYSNTLRVKITEVENDSLFGFVGFHYNYTTYYWYDGTHRNPVFYIQYYSSYDSQDPSTISKSKSVMMSYVPATTAINELSNNDLKASLFPNPSDAGYSHIQFSLKNAGSTVISVFNELGQTIQTLDKGILQAGSYTEQINTNDLPKGVYFVKTQSGNFFTTNKLIIR